MVMISIIDSILVPHDTTYRQDCYMSFSRDYLVVLGTLRSYTQHRRVLSARPNAHVFFNAAEQNNMKQKKSCFFSASRSMH